MFSCLLRECLSHFIALCLFVLLCVNRGDCTESATDCVDVPSAKAAQCGHCLFVAKMLNVIPPLPVMRAWSPPGLPHDLALIVVEMRRHKLLEPVVWSFAHAYGGSKNTSLWIVHGSENSDFVHILFASWPNVQFIDIATASLEYSSYSTLFFQPSFWGNFKQAQFALIFQTDSGIFQRIPQEWFNYSYVGAPWGQKICTQSGQLCSEVGNGGLSLRRVQVILDLITFSSGKLQGTEDIAFSALIDEKPTPDVAKFFSVETVFYPTPVGIHNAWKYLPFAQVEEILNRPFIGEKMSLLSNGTCELNL